MANNINSSLDQQSFDNHANDALRVANAVKNETAVVPEATVEVSRIKRLARFTGRSVVGAAAVGVVGVTFGGYVADAESDRNRQEKMVKIEAPASGTAWDLAREVRDKDASLREVSDAIAEQADKQGYKGVDAYEVYTLPDKYVSEEAEREYAPDQPQQ